jgi:hypothetical protein
VLEDIRAALQRWEREDVKGQVVINRLDGGDIDLILSPRKRYKKDGGKK